MQTKQHNHIHLTILILIPLLVGLLTFNHYGESTDESPLYDYSTQSLQAYQGLTHLNLNPDLGKGNFRYYGPAFLMIANLATKLTTAIFGKLNLVDAWHLMYFLSFLAGVVGFYFLIRRWFSDQAAFAAAALFASQPLLWGHAFINPKDIPFMSFCILSMYTGLTMLDKIFLDQSIWAISDLKSMNRLWRDATQNQRTKLIVNTVLFVFLVGLYLFGQHLIQNILTAILQSAFSAAPGSAIANVLSTFAKNYQNTPPENYVPRLMKLVHLVMWLLTVVFAFNIFRYAWNIFSEPKVKVATVISSYVRDTLEYLKIPSIILAGIILGLTTSIRILGPALGLIILIIAIYRAKIKAWSAISAYFLVAAITTYLTWPFLWANPLSRTRAIVNYTSDFPWLGKILFSGIYYPADRLPGNYVPRLFELQFTEPALLLFFIGIILIVYKIWKRAIPLETVVVTIGWGILPLIAFTVWHLNLYENIRQLFFIVPPLFIIAGFTLDWIAQRIRQPIIQYGIMIVLLLPGIYAIWNLHPYEYTYYNSFAKLTVDNQRQFESDYWMTSFRETIEYLNETAPQNAKVVIYGSNLNTVTDFARKDLIVEFYKKNSFDLVTGYDYAIITSRYDWDLYTFQDWPTIYTVQRNGNIFAVVKQRP